MLCLHFTQSNMVLFFVRKMGKISRANNLFYGMVLKSLLLKIKLNWNKKACKILNSGKLKFYCIFYRPKLSNLRYFYKILLKLFIVIQLWMGFWISTFHTFYVDYEFRCYLLWFSHFWSVFYTKQDCKVLFSKSTWYIRCKQPFLLKWLSQVNFVEK